LAKDRHLRHRHHVLARPLEQHHMRVVDHHRSRPWKYSSASVRKTLHSKRREARIHLEIQHPRVAQHQRCRLHFNQRALHPRPVREVSAAILPPVRIRSALPAKAPRAQSRAAGRTPSGPGTTGRPSLTSSSCTRPMCPLHARAVPESDPVRLGQLPSLNCSTTALPISITLPTALREILSARAILRVPALFTKFENAVRVFCVQHRFAPCRNSPGTSPHQRAPVAHGSDLFALAGGQLVPQSLCTSL